VLESEEDETKGLRKRAPEASTKEKEKRVTKGANLNPRRARDAKASARRAPRTSGRARGGTFGSR
jgi:hypothetical protein